GQAQEHLAVRVGSTARQQLAQAPLPGRALAVQEQQLLGQQPHGPGLGAGQVRRRRQRLGVERRADAGGGAVGPAVVLGPEERRQLVGGGPTSVVDRRPAGQERQGRGRVQV